MLESGGFESRERVLVVEPVVESSWPRARTLGVTYWQAVCISPPAAASAPAGGAAEASSSCSAARNAAHLRGAGALVRRRAGRLPVRHPGGLLALRAGGSMNSAQRPDGDQQELNVTVEEYLPRLAARAGAPLWTGMDSPREKGKAPSMSRSAVATLGSRRGAGTRERPHRLRRNRRRWPGARAPAGRARADRGLAHRA